METPEGHRTVPAWKCLQELCLDSSPCGVLEGGTLMPSAESEVLMCFDWCWRFSSHLIEFLIDDDLTTYLGEDERNSDGF